MEHRSGERAPVAAHDRAPIGILAGTRCSRELYEAERFPIYAYEYESGHICYGFPRLPRGVKASVMHSGDTVRDAGSVERTVNAAEVKRCALRCVRCYRNLRRRPSVRVVCACLPTRRITTSSSTSIHSTGKC